MMRSFKKLNPKHYAGVSLVEVLVTVVVISVGLLGVAALHLNSLRNSYDSTVRSKAVWLANDIIEHMRANRVAARAGQYDVALGASLTPGTMAATDINAWRATLLDPLQGIPSGKGSVATNTVGTTVISTVIVEWTERDGTHSFTTQTEI